MPDDNSTLLPIVEVGTSYYPKQLNGYDCGVHVVLATRMLASLCGQHKSVRVAEVLPSIPACITPNAITNERKYNTRIHRTPPILSMRCLNIG